MRGACLLSHPCRVESRSQSGLIVKFSDSASASAGASAIVGRWRLCARCVLLLLSLLVPAACGPAGGGSSVTQRDSAGIRIVESRGPVWTGADAWRLTETATLTIGPGEGSSTYRLNQPFSATRLSDGTIVVANWGTRELHWFDAQGRHVRTAGGAGTAPGQFTYLSWITRTRGDSVLAADAGRPQVTVFSASGSPGRVTDLPTLRGLARFTASVSQSGVLLSVSERATASPQLFLARDTFRLIHHDPSIPRTDTLGSFPGAWTYRQMTPGGGIAAWSPPFRGHTTVASGGGRVYVGDADAGQVLVYEPAGRLRAIFRRVREPRMVGEDEMNQFRDFVQSTAPDEEQRLLREEAYREIPFPETMPAFQSIAADPRGRVWVQEYATPWESESQRWSVFEASGGWLGSLELPARLVVLEVGEDYVLGVWREGGSESIRLYGLRK